MELVKQVNERKEYDMETSFQKNDSPLETSPRESWECTQIFMISEIQKRCTYLVMGNWLNKLQ